jgi:hypothetical protein
MNKTEIKKAINKAVYQYAESLGYGVYDDNDGSYVTFVKGGHSSGKESIDYSRSQHDTAVLNWASNETKADAALIDDYAKEQIKKYI